MHHQRRLETGLTSALLGGSERPVIQRYVLRRVLTQVTAPPDQVLALVPYDRLVVTLLDPGQLVALGVDARLELAGAGLASVADAVRS